MTENNQNKKEEKLGWRRAVADNLFFLRLIWRGSKLLIPVYFLNALFNSASHFFMDTYLFMYVLNALQDGTPVRKILTVVGGLIAFTLFTYVFRAVNWYVFDTQMPKVDCYINNLLSDKAAAVELACFESPAFYDTYVKAMDEAGDRAQLVLGSLSDILWVVVNVAATGALIISIHPAFLLFAAIPLLLTLLLGKKQNKLNYDREMKDKEQNRRKDYVNRTFYLKDFSSEMRLCEMYRVMLRQMRDSIKALTRIANEYGYKQMWFAYLFDVIYSVFVYMGSILLASYMTLVRRAMPLGDCFVIINSVTDIAYSIGYLGSTAMSLDRNARYIENLRSFLDYDIKIPENTAGKTADTHQILEVRDLSFGYEGQEKPSLSHINLTLHRGEKIALVGLNGAGKTTLVKLLLRLYDPTAGGIYLNGTDIRDYRLSSYRSLFGTVFQDYRLFSLTVAENVLLRGDITDADRKVVRDSLEKSGILERIDALPQGMDTIVTREFDDEGAVFSGGEAQKLAIARIFALNPEIAIMDEPTSALDPLAEDAMYKNMFAACENKALLFISHRLSSATVADRICFMEQGEIVEEGTHTELLARNGKYAAMWFKQAQRYTGSGEEAAE